MLGFGRRKVRLSAGEAATGIAMLVWSWDHRRVFSASGIQVPPDLAVRRELFLLQLLMGLAGAEEALRQQKGAFPAVAAAFPTVHLALVEFLADGRRASEAAELMPHLAHNLDDIRRSDPIGYQRMKDSWAIAPTQWDGLTSLDVYDSTLRSTGDLTSVVRAMQDFAPASRDPVLQLVVGITLRMTREVALDVSQRWQVR